jgi:arylsulfatase A-like enzyme
MPEAWKPQIRSPKRGVLSLTKVYTYFTMKKKNILLMVSDNQRPDTIAVHGNPFIQTPHLDALARAGTMFRNAYFMGSTMGATCLPSRTMLMTGRHLFRIPHGEVSEEEEAAHPIANIRSLPGLLKAHEYRSMRTGKQGNYPRFVAQEFDKNVVVARSVDGSARHADNAIEFLESDQSDRPFFLYVAFGAPNDPHVGPGTAPPEYMDMYPNGSVPVPDNYLPMHPFDNGEMIIRDELLAPWPRTKDVVEQHLAGYYSVISYMDAQIGRIMSCLRETGHEDDTIVVFTSDTGTAIGSHGLMGMQNLYEHSIGVPMIVSAPGMPKGVTSDALVYLSDLLPTICELMAIPVPDGVDGKSLLPVLEGRSSGVRDSIFSAYRDVQRAVRDERWKLIRYPRADKTQLFDLLSDPQECHDLADERTHGPKVEQMLTLLEEWQRRLGDAAIL